MKNGKQLKVRLPDDVWAWISEQARRFGGSLNSEVVRSVRERMDREDAHAK